MANDCDRVPVEDVFEGELPIELSVFERPNIRDVFPGLLEGEMDIERFELEEKTVSKILDRFCGSFEGVAERRTGLTPSLMQGQKTYMSLS